MNSLTNDRKVLLIGWDAADWKVISPLIDQGKMPNLEQLVNGGVMGNIATLFPVLSPMLWTSIATGKRAYKHGIHGFSEPDPATGRIRPITNLSRKTKAVWNILNQNGKQCNVVGWWPSYPAEPLNGVMVADQFKSPPGKLEDPWPMRKGLVHPEELSKHLAPMRIHPYELEQEHILPFIPKAAEIDQAKEKRLTGLAKSIAECSTIHAVATAIMQLEPWDFMAVYYDAIDHFSHGFMKFHPPKQEHISDEDFEMYKDVVEGAYKYHDMMLGVLMHLAGEETTILLMSDHGFHPDHLRPVTLPNEPAGPADEHRNYGIFVMNGPGIKKDERIHGTTLLDVAPTILNLFGLPIGSDMDGKVVANAFEEDPIINTIESWDDVEGDSGQHPAETQLDPVESQESLNQLVALGYIDKPDEDQSKAVDQTVRELQHNLARAYIGANQHKNALEIYEKLWEKWPDQNRFGVKIIECHLSMDEVSKARKTMGKLIESKKHYSAKAQEELKELSEELKDIETEDYSDEQKEKLRKLRPAANTNMRTIAFLFATILRREGEYEEALEKLKVAEEIQMHNRADVHLLRGEIYLDMKNWLTAEHSFRDALDIDHENSQGHLGLCRSYLPRRMNQVAAEAALKSLGLTFFNPRGHFYYGIALQRCGHHESALQALKTAVQQNPNFPEAHKRLAHILRNQFEDFEAAEIHKENAKIATKLIRDIKSGKVSSTKNQPLIDSLDEVMIEDSVGSVTASPEEVITIVSGLPRSGTSMAMQMLAAAGLEILTDDVRTADEDNPKGYYEYEPVKKLRDDMSWLENAKGKVVKIIAQLLPTLPSNFQYKILFMDRDLNEIIASQNKMLERSDETGGDINDAALAKTYIKQVQAVKKIVASHPSTDLLNVNYSLAIESPQEMAERITDFLNLPLPIKKMQEAVCPALYRQRSCKD